MAQTAPILRMHHLTVKTRGRMQLTGEDGASLQGDRVVVVVVVVLALKAVHFVCLDAQLELDED